jgi:hypothetical protein
MESNGFVTNLPYQLFSEEKVRHQNSEFFIISCRQWISFSFSFLVDRIQTSVLCLPNSVCKMLSIQLILQSWELHVEIALCSTLFNIAILHTFFCSKLHFHEVYNVREAI